MTRKRLADIGKQLLTWLAIVIACLALWAFQDYLDISVGTWLLFVGFAMYMQFTLSKLEERIGLEQLPTFDAMMELNSITPINPKHEISNGIPEEGWGVTEEVLLFYRHFSKFGDVMNDWLKDSPWRLQEVAGTDVATLGDDGPVLGRRYKIFHGSQVAGKVSLSDGLDYSLESPATHAVIELYDARDYHAETVMDLFGGLASILASGSRDEIDKAYLGIRTAMIEAMWRIGPNVVQNADLEIRFTGSAKHYLRLAHLAH